MPGSQSSVWLTLMAFSKSSAVFKVGTFRGSSCFWLMRSFMTLSKSSCLLALRGRLCFCRIRYQQHEQKCKL